MTCKSDGEVCNLQNYLLYTGEKNARRKIYCLTWIHAFTCSDTVSAFSDKGKVTEHSKNVVHLRRRALIVLFSPLPALYLGYIFGIEQLLKRLGFFILYGSAAGIFNAVNGLMQILFLRPKRNH